jgi:type IV pilus assembly protein PilY1
MLSVLACSSFAVTGDESSKIEFHASDYFSLPYIPDDISQGIILLEIEQSKSMLKRAYSSSYFGADQKDGLVGYFNPQSQYYYNSEWHYFEEYKPLKRGGQTQVKLWDGKFLNWLLMRQIDMTRYILLGSKEKNGNSSDEIIALDSSRHKIILQDAKSLLYSPIPNTVAITLDGGQLKYQEKYFQLRLKKTHDRKGLLDLLTNNIKLYFYAHKKQKFIFGDAQKLPSYLNSWSVSEPNKEPQVSLKRALDKIKKYSLKLKNTDHQNKVCQRYVYISLSSYSNHLPFLIKNNLLSDCQKSLSGKQALTYFHLKTSEKLSVSEPNQFSFHETDTLMASLFSALSGRDTEGSFQISGADIANFSDQAGVIYQSLFKSALKETKDDLHWVGDLRATLIDEQGRLRSDNGDKILGSLEEDPLISSCFDEHDKLLRIRFLTSSSIEENCNSLNYPLLEKDVGYLWRASDSLNKFSQTSINEQRTFFQSNDAKRYMRTHIGQLEYDFVATGNHNNYPVKPEWLNVSTPEEANKLIAYVRGQDQAGFRLRQTDQNTFFLADTTNSAPIAVGKPESNYHLLYGDQSYLLFLKQYQNRRSRVFLGTNDGVLHSFNAGWFDNKTKQLKNSSNNSSNWALGQETWAFVPFSILPYLNELSDKYYGISAHHHLNLAPQRPYIFDARIFDKDSRGGQPDRAFIDQEGHLISQKTHPQGWGTLMVVGTGLSKSSYLVFDITDAEQAPKLMAELQTENIGSPISLASVMTQKDSQGEWEWFLILGTGTDLDPSSVNKLSTKRSAGVYIFNLTTLQSKYAPSKAKFIDLKESMSYVSGISAADWNLDGETDALYLNTTSIEKSTGSLYRINMQARALGKSGLEVEKLIEVSAPLIERPQLSMDAMNNRWIYISTGHNKQVKNKIIGIKEPRDSQGNFLVETTQQQNQQVALDSLVDVSEILVDQKTGKLTGNWVIQVPLTENTVKQLEQRLMQFSESSKYVHGWLRSLDTNEVAIGPSKLFGGLLIQASYKADYQNCLLSADTFMHRLRFTTGTAWYSPYALKNKTMNTAAVLKTTKSNSFGSKEITSTLLQQGSKHIQELHSLTNGQTQTVLEESRELVKSGEVSWREL